MNAAIASVPLWLIVLIKSAILLLVVITTFAYSMLAERKVMAWMQLRPGPNRVGPWGMLQPAADALKMMFKEDLTPNTADLLIYRLAPFISLICAMGVFAIIPFTGDANGAYSIGNVNAGILFVCHDAVMQSMSEALCGRWLNNRHGVPFRFERTGEVWTVDEVT